MTTESTITPTYPSYGPIVDESKDPRTSVPHCLKFIYVSGSVSIYSLHSVTFDSSCQVLVSLGLCGGWIIDLVMGIRMVGLSLAVSCV